MNHKPSDWTIFCVTVYVCLITFVVALTWAVNKDISIIQSRLDLFNDRMFNVEINEVALAQRIEKLEELLRYSHVAGRKVQYGDRVCSDEGYERMVVGVSTPGVGFALIRLSISEPDGAFGTLVLPVQGCYECMGIVRTLKDVEKYMKKNNYTFAPCKKQ